MAPCSNVSTTKKSVDKSIYLEMESEDGHGYMVVVVEYQKRGLHHAHIAYRPAKSPASKSLPIGEEVPWVDHMICAQLPTDENRQDIMDRFGLTNDEFEKLKPIVAKTMSYCTSTANGDRNTARPNSRSTTSTSCPCLRRRSQCAAASTSSTNTPTSTPTKQLNTRLTEINFD